MYNFSDVDPVRSAFEVCSTEENNQKLSLQHVMNNMECMKFLHDGFGISNATIIEMFPLLDQDQDDFISIDEGQAYASNAVDRGLYRKPKEHLCKRFGGTYNFNTFKREACKECMAIEGCSRNHNKWHQHRQLKVQCNCKNGKCQIFNQYGTFINDCW